MLNTCGILAIVFMVVDAAEANPPKLRPVIKAKLFMNRPFLLSVSLFVLFRFLDSSFVVLYFDRLRFLQKLPFSIIVSWLLFLSRGTVSSGLATLVGSVSQYTSATKRVVGIGGMNRTTWPQNQHRNIIRIVVYHCNIWRRLLKQWWGSPSLPRRDRNENEVTTRRLSNEIKKLRVAPMFSCEKVCLVDIAISMIIPSI